MGRRIRAALLAAAAAGSIAGAGAAVRPSIDWTAYAGDAAGSKYSRANQITRANVATLVPVWTYRTGDYGVGRTQARDETTPIFVDGVLYISTPFGGVRAVDGATGRERWAFDAELDLAGDYGDFTNRGVSTWLDPSASAAAPCRRRIFIAPVDARLIALDARTGVPCAGFGERGQLHLDRGLLNTPAYQSEYSVTSPPAIVNGLVVVGSAISDGKRAAAPNGIVRAFDARTGALKWSWDPVARESAQPGYDTWRGPAAHSTGAANAWSIISVDPVRDLVFVPVGSASPDFYGGERLGRNLFANSVVALRASTGHIVWHFQAVHHDLWDYDIPAQPVLFSLRRGGREIPALAQPTKMGFLFVLNRETGEPLFPVDERPVPASDVAGEEAWPTQPFPTRPPPLVPVRLTADDAFGVSADSRAWCRERIASLRSEGIFTPPSVRGSIAYPGNVGGSNWSGAAFDPVRRLAFLPLNRLATVIELIPRDQYRDAQRRSGRDYEVAPQAGTPFAMRRQTMAAPDGVPCTPPPFGTMTAVDLDSGEVKWSVPFGRVSRFAHLPGSESWGSPSLGGSLATAGGLVFAGGTMDQRIRALDAQTGAEVWSYEMPAGVHAAPMTYSTSAGRQFLIVVAGGHKDLGTTPGDFVVAFALPENTTARAAASKIVSGHYEGRMILDTTRAPAAMDLTIADDAATIALVTQRDLKGTGKGIINGGSGEFEVEWEIAPRKCSGTMHLTGTAANAGTALIGEVAYKDGCDSGKEKRGTFALWRGPRSVASLPR